MKIYRRENAGNEVRMGMKKYLKNGFDKQKQ